MTEEKPKVLSSWALANIDATSPQTAVTTTLLRFPTSREPPYNVEFDEALLTLPVLFYAGKISKIVRQPFGFYGHVITILKKLCIVSFRVGKDPCLSPWI